MLIAHLMLSRLLVLQVNVVVMRGVNDDEIADFVELTRDHAINVRFIEYMPFDGNVWSDTKMVTYKQMMAAVHQRFPDELQRMRVSSHLMAYGTRAWLLFECPPLLSFCKMHGMGPVLLTQLPLHYAFAAAVGCMLLVMPSWCFRHIYATEVCSAYVPAHPVPICSHLLAP